MQITRASATNESERDGMNGSSGVKYEEPIVSRGREMRVNEKKSW
jgi:hypothetical protein